jgi:DNA-directed RNA polymerase subunit E'/Rpb7
METTAFFEKKISLTPSEFNEVKITSLDDILLRKVKLSMENKCSEQGFILPGSIALLSRSMGYFESARFTGDAIYYVKLEGKVVYPADGIRVVGEVIRKNKMGIYVNYNNAIRIQVPRDLHLGSEEYDEVEIGDFVQIELKRSKFAIHDPYILASGLFINKQNSGTNVKNASQPLPSAHVDTSEDESGSDQEEMVGQKEEEEEEEEEDEEDEEEEEEEEEAEE